MVSARASRKHGSAGLATVRPPRRQPKERRRDTDGERCTREPNYGDAEGAERWPAALPAKARPAAPKLLTDAVFDVLPPVKHRSRAPKGYHKAATIDVAAEEDGKGTPRRKKAPGRPKKTTSSRSKSASVSVPLPAECSTEQKSRPSCRAIELTLAAAGVIGVVYALKTLNRTYGLKDPSVATLTPPPGAPPPQFVSALIGLVLLPPAPPPLPPTPSAPRPMPPPPWPPTPAPRPPSPMSPADVECYALRYDDLLAGFCGGALGGCDWTKLQEHGTPQARQRGASLHASLSLLHPRRRPRRRTRPRRLSHHPCRARRQLHRRRRQRGNRWARPSPAPVRGRSMSAFDDCPTLRGRSRGSCPTWAY